MSAGRRNNSDKKDWNTPPKYINPIKHFFGGQIDLDPCSNKFSTVNAKQNFVYPAEDGLVQPWEGNKIFINPPSGFPETVPMTTITRISRAVNGSASCLTTGAIIAGIMKMGQTTVIISLC